MARKKHRFQSPPPADPIAAARDSSLVFRLNFGFFLHQSRHAGAPVLRVIEYARGGHGRQQQIHHQKNRKLAQEKAEI